MKLYHHQRQIHRNRLKHIDKFWSSIHHQSSHHHCVIVIVDVSSFILFFIASILCELEQKLILGPSLHCHTVTSMFFSIYEYIKTYFVHGHVGTYLIILKKKEDLTTYLPTRPANEVCKIHVYLPTTYDRRLGT